MITLTPSSAPASTSRNGRGGAVAEDYYSLVHWLRAVGDASGIASRSVGLTSCTRGAGTSSVASNLAIAAAGLSDRPVLLLDLSTPYADVPTRRAACDRAGLREALLDVEHAGQYAGASPIANLSLLSANSFDELQALSLDSVKLNELLESLERDFGFVVIDLPTVDSSLCFVAAGLLDGVLLVMEAERTRVETAARAKQRLIDARANVLGAILNKHAQHLPSWLAARL